MLCRKFQSKLDFLRIFKVAQKSGQSPCTIVHGLEPNFMKNEDLSKLVNVASMFAFVS